ncbi:MAG: helix-turn-helix domain-containing protein [Christensenellales bacterium]
MSFTMKDAYSVMLREYPDVMNIEQMSQALGVSTYGLLKSGKVACLKVGRAYRIPKAWCEMRGVTVTSEIKRFVMSELDNIMPS